VIYDGVKQALAASTQADEVRTDLTRRGIGDLSMRLAGTYGMQVFGKPDRLANCDCERNNQPTLLQSIFLQNDPLVDERLAECGWLEEIARQEAAGVTLNSEELIREAWLRTVGRPPGEAETKRAMEFLTTAESRIEGLRDVLWALINNKEFVLNH